MTDIFNSRCKKKILDIETINDEEGCEKKHKEEVECKKDGKCNCVKLFIFDNWHIYYIDNKSKKPKMESWKGEILAKEKFNKL